jgi:Lon protease-like protein
MIELPLFPLQSVIFPGMPITLHIFEERYKQMFDRCIKNIEPFGAVLIKRGMEALGPLAEPYDIGCMAHVAIVEKLSDGRMNIVALGTERFRIVTLHTEGIYLVGEVERLPMEYEADDLLLQADLQLRPWVERYMQIMENAKLVKGSLDRLPSDPMEFANMAAYLLQVPVKQKQTLLEANRATRLMGDAQAMYRKEVALLKRLLSRRSIDEDDIGPSLN